MKNNIQKFVFLTLTLFIAIASFGHDLKSSDKNYTLVVAPTISSFSPTSGLTGTTVTINISSLNSGIYIVKIDHDGKTFLQKVIKQ